VHAARAQSGTTAILLGKAFEARVIVTCGAARRHAPRSASLSRIGDSTKTTAKLTSSRRRCARPTPGRRYVILYYGGLGLPAPAMCRRRLEVTYARIATHGAHQVGARSAGPLMVKRLTSQRLDAALRSRFRTKGPPR